MSAPHRAVVASADNRPVRGKSADQQGRKGQTCASCHQIPLRDQPGPLGPSRTRYRLNPSCLYKKERLSAIGHRLERQPAAGPQAIAHRHSRSSPGEHNWDFTRLVGIDHQDHADDRAVPVCVYLADIPHQDDVVMMPWNSHPASSARPSRQPFWGVPSADCMIFYPSLACQSALRLIETMNENILAVHRQYQ